jgi:hypothetical protein
MGSTPVQEVALAKVGFQRFKLDGDSIFRLKARIEARTGPFENYSPEDFIDSWVELSKRVHLMWEWEDLIQENLDKIKYFTGIENLLYQKEPYTRVARKDRPEDNIGIHRDTHYGATTEEWVLWAPLTHAIQGGELRMIAGSHNESDEAYPWVQVESDQVKRGSDEHWLGFRYAPKKMSAQTEALCSPVPCFVGEAIIFNSACVHGQVVNKAPWTRVSIDIRVCDVNAKVQKTRGLHGEIYSSL